jgi:hypothetical protein
MTMLSPEMVREVRFTVGVIALFGLVGSVAAIVAGGIMVYLGSSGGSEIVLFGQKINTLNVGVPCVFLGIVALILILRGAFKTLNNAIAAR